MSVLTEINRIKTSVTAIVTSIENKGVAVPDGTTIDKLPPYVDSIATPKTCTVNIIWTITPSDPTIVATTFVNGAVSVFRSLVGSGTVSIPNVVCGSALVVDTNVESDVYDWAGVYSTANSADAMFLLTVPSAPGTYDAEIGVFSD